MTEHKLYDVYCETQGPGSASPDPGDHLHTTPKFRNGHPGFEVRTVSLASSSLSEIGEPDTAGGRRLRGPALPDEDAKSWDVLCGVCGAHVRRKRLR